MAGRPGGDQKDRRPAQGGGTRPAAGKPGGRERTSGPGARPAPARPAPQPGAARNPRSRRSRARATSPAPIKSAARKEALTAVGLLESYRPDMFRILDEAGAPAFRYAQVVEHLFRRPGTSLSEASALPEDLRAALEKAGHSTLRVAGTRKASDGTTKLLLASRDGCLTEAVSMPYGQRMTVCVSSQVGCAVGCAFCATGGMGFKRNLSAAEIVDQLRAAVAAAEPQQRLTNVVYMGMGEPLLNLGAVLESVRILTSPAGLGLGHRSLSISTVGIPSGIVRLARAEPQVNLAVSLHAADDTTRALLIPEQFCRPIQDVLEAAWEHFAITRRKLLVEYVLLAGVNDSVDDARRLAALLRGHVVAVNLLAWNPVQVGGGDASHLAGDGRETAQGRARGSDAASRQGPRTFLPSTPAAVAAFRSALRDSHIEAVVRQSKGGGIEAACGQLAGSARTYPDESAEPAVE